MSTVTALLTNKAYGYPAMAAAKLLETGELEGRIATLEAAIGVGRDTTDDTLLPRRAGMTTAERRLAKVEAALSPTALVLRWLAEAHAYGDLESFTASLLDADPRSFPLDRLGREAQASARERTRGLPREDANRAIERAIVGALFRVLLVLRINVLAHEAIEREVLLQGCLSAHLGLAIQAGDDGAPDRAGLGLAQIRDLMLGRVNELHAMETARVAVEARYLEGSPALFPAIFAAWTDQVTASERMAVIAERLVELDGADPPLPDDMAAFETRVAALVADYVEPALSHAYDELGDGRRAMRVALRWLRPKLLAEQIGLAGAGDTHLERQRESASLENITLRKNEGQKQR